MVKACRRLPVNTTTLVLFHRLRIEDVERRADNTPQSGARVRNGNSSPSPPVTLALSLECHHCHHPPRVVLILRNKTLRATHRSRTFQQKLQKLRSELTNQNTIQQVKAHESRCCVPGDSDAACWESMGPAERPSVQAARRESETACVEPLLTGGSGLSGLSGGSCESCGGCAGKTNSESPTTRTRRPTDRPTKHARRQTRKQTNTAVQVGTKTNDLVPTPPTTRHTACTARRNAKPNEHTELAVPRGTRERREPNARDRTK